ncbi:ferritin family protein [Candidatus Parabeggiatoa sp. HSG14]|uniref:ferritin family protein n=1 Tax=Candidatus Parabeggiatoa sp. HSG14 TaxID=3055593 RepID=UPI0025A81CDE|nr:ferritin family protein [Thiotrichales bacterium HSG14]
MNTEKKSKRESEGYRELTRKTTIGEILETASAFEQTAMNFYTMLKDKVGKNLRPLVEELADEEKRHFELFQDLNKNPQVIDKIKELIVTPPNDHRFSDYIQTPKLKEFPDDQAILQYALGREQAAMEQYAALAEETPPGALHDLFHYLAQEELTHKNELEKRYYELVHSGGV